MGSLKSPEEKIQAQSCDENEAADECGPPIPRRAVVRRSRRQRVNEPAEFLIRLLPARGERDDYGKLGR